jgi:hypothetical protein
MLKLHTNKTDFFVRQLIDMRNSIAHGRKAYYNKAVYPVLPFFPIIKNILYPVKYLRIFVAQIMCLKLEVSLYEEEWNEVEKELIISHTEMKDYLKSNTFNKIEYISNKNIAVHSRFFKPTAHSQRTKKRLRQQYKYRSLAVIREICH